MDLIEAIKERHSVRKYKDKPVHINDVLELLNIAKEAPSSGNMQNWRFIIVSDEKKKKDLAIASLNQVWMQEAAVYIVICNEYNEIVDNYEKQGKKYSIQNCAIVAQNIMLIAKSFKLDTCFVGAFDESAVKRILKIPDSIDVEAIITLGHGNDDSIEKKYDLEILTSVNEFGSRKTPKGSLVKDLLKRLKK